MMQLIESVIHLALVHMVLSLILLEIVKAIVHSAISWEDAFSNAQADINQMLTMVVYFLQVQHSANYLFSN
jgi:hypothetical protein